MNIESYRQTESEKARTASLMGLLPQGRSSVLDVGARDGHFSRLLTPRFASVTALDLEKPNFDLPGVTGVAGDATNLQFPDNSFDCVFCAEVLEHIPNVKKAALEIARVARYEIVIGVPFRQDTRVGRTTCPGCGGICPPWGHVNAFDENTLLELFPGCVLTAREFAGSNDETTSTLATWLMDLGRNPWGTYGQEEPCIHCGARLEPPKDRPLWRRCCSSLAARMNKIQSRFTAPHQNWIHAVFSKGAVP